MFVPLLWGVVKEYFVVDVGPLLTEQNIISSIALFVS